MVVWIVSKWYSQLCYFLLMGHFFIRFIIILFKYRYRCELCLTAKSLRPDNSHLPSFQLLFLWYTIMVFILEILR